MSTFPGPLPEIPGISIDRFDGANFESEIYFLSHCHQDHMVGLDEEDFHVKLKEKNQFVYMTSVSAEICRRLVPQISSQLVELDTIGSTVLEIGGKIVSVTPIPAGHCPGSIMLLFESEKVILYTGDYRINSSDIPKLRAFYNCINHRKIIDKIYLDTTFFLKEYQSFPPRSESLEEICRIISSWIEKSSRHVIKLSTSARYGYEYLFIEIYKKLKMPVHVNKEAFDFYSAIPEMDKAVTRSGNSTRIHCSCGEVYTDICRNSIFFNIKVVRISAWRWQTATLQNGISDLSKWSHNVCYSTHASYEEGLALLKFLEPKEVVPSVLHGRKNADEEIFKNLKECVKDEVEAPPEKRKLFKISDDKETKEEKDVNISSFILDSPPRKVMK